MYCVCSLVATESVIVSEMSEKGLSTSVLLVTGGCGFIASNFINHILSDEKLQSVIGIVINYDLLINDSNKFHVYQSHAHSPRYTLVTGDIRNRKLLEQTLHKHSVDTVVHFAALTYVCDSFKEPVDYVRTNLEGTVTLLESCRSYGHLKRFVYVSTDEVYGDSVMLTTVDQRLSLTM